MRALTDAGKINHFMQELGRRARGPGSIFLTGGATAVLVGWRSTTVDIDLKLDPEPPGAFGAIAELKEELDVNVELAAPDDFIPPVPGWRERSQFIATHGQVQFFHYDFSGQALAKIERGHARDLADVQALLIRGLVAPADLRRRFAEIVPGLPRYPAIDRDEFERKLREALGEAGA